MARAIWHDTVDQVNRDASWCYPSTKDEAKHVEGWIAFWRGATVER
jgi:uncharacterized protein (DUF427 family)